MSIKILLTSDLHLGMKFAGYPDVQAALSEARFICLERLINMANEKQCDLLVIAGDLFDRINVAKKDVLKAAKIIKNFEGKLTAILPGNHDYLSKGQPDFWATLKDSHIDNLLLMEDRKVYSLDHYDMNASLYACPCYSKHSSENAIGWIDDEENNSKDIITIGVAHGSLDGFSPDFDKTYYPMTVNELQKSGLDLWLLGHTHVQYPVKPGISDRIFYAGTPEPDGFDCTHSGTAWLIDIGDDKKVNSQSVDMGTYRFTHDEAVLSSIAELDQIVDKYSNDDSKRILLKLKLRGSLPKDEYVQLSGLLSKLRKQLFYLNTNNNELTEKITIAEINQEFSEGSFPHALLSGLSGDPEALQLAYEMIIEVRK